MKNVMTRAWEIARGGQKKFGGKVKEYFAQALVMAWAEAKAPAKKTMQEVATLIQGELGTLAKVNVWERYGKRRIYVNKGFKDQVTMIEFDQDDNIISNTKLDSLDYFGAVQNGIGKEFTIVYEVVKAIA